MRSIIAMILSSVLLLLVIGCGGSNKNSEQTSTKTATTQDTAKPKDNSVFIIGTEVNAREKASTDSGILGTFELGEKIVVIADEGEWAKVKRSNGQECYVFRKYLGTQEDLGNRKARFAGFTVINKGIIDSMMQRDKATRTDRIFTGMRYSPSFAQDGITDLQFTAIVDNEKMPQKVSFNADGKELWSTRLVMAEVYASNDVMQIKDNAFGKVLYTLGEGVEAYILAYEPNDKKAVVLLDSTKMNGPYSESDVDAKGFLIKDGQLYLVIRTVTSHPQKPSVAYHLFWDKKAGGLGYEYIGNYNF